MPLDESKLNRLKALLEVANEGLSEKKFQEQFEALIKLVISIEKKLQENNEKAIRQLEETLKLVQNKSNSTLEEVKEKVKEKLGKIKEGSDGYTPVKNKDYFDGKPGYSPIKGKDYFDGKNADEEKILKELIKKLPKTEEIVDKIPMAGEKVRDALELLNGDERLDSKAIKNLNERFKKIEERMMAITSKAMGRSRAYGVDVVDLSSNVDGKNRIFTIPTDTDAILGVWSSQFPFTLNSNDWIKTGNTFTFHASVPTIESGQTLMCLIRTAFQR